MGVFGIYSSGVWPLGVPEYLPEYDLKYRLGTRVPPENTLY